MQSILEQALVSGEDIALNHMLSKRIELDQYILDRYYYSQPQDLDADVIEKLHEYADIVCQYFIGCGIPCTYDRDWDGNYTCYMYGVGKWRISSNYCLTISLTEPASTDIWVGLSTRQYVWTYLNSEEVLSITNLVPTVERVIKQVQACDYCSPCHYVNSTIQYCGKGLELMLGCASFKRYESI